MKSKQQILAEVKAELPSAAIEFQGAIALLVWCADSDAECFDSDHNEDLEPEWAKESTNLGKAISYLNQ